MNQFSTMEWDKFVSFFVEISDLLFSSLENCEALRLAELLSLKRRGNLRRKEVTSWTMFFLDRHNILEACNTVLQKQLIGSLYPHFLLKMSFW